MTPLDSEWGRSLPEFDAWYLLFAPRLVRMLNGLTHNHDLAQELAAEALSRAVAHWSRITADGDTPDAWTTRVAINLWRRSGRTRTRDAARPPPWLVEGSEEQPTMPDEELWTAVMELPRRQREVIVLRYVMDLSERATARAIGVSEGSASASLAKARARLRRTLDDGE